MNRIVEGNNKVLLALIQKVARQRGMSDSGTLVNIEHDERGKIVGFLDSEKSSSEIPRDISQYLMRFGFRNQFFVERVFYGRRTPIEARENLILAGLEYNVSLGMPREESKPIGSENRR